MKNGFTYGFLILLAGVVAWQIDQMGPTGLGQASPGLEVYLGEGCIHCHSQYRRPVGYDRQLWGGPTDTETEMERQKPVVFGNRRQGPDLSNIGVRRSRAWNREHLKDPRGLRPGSRMPAYDYLFAEGETRGEALLDYLQELGQDDRKAWLEGIATWRPEASLDRGDAASGARLFNQYCVACHGREGRGDGPMASHFTPPPRDLARPGEWQWISPDAAVEARRLELARTIKFGRPGTAMAGTEWLADSQLADLIRYLETLEAEEVR